MGMGSCGKGGKGEELKNRRTEAIGTKGIQTSGLFGLHAESN